MRGLGAAWGPLGFLGGQAPKPQAAPSVKDRRSICLRFLLSSLQLSLLKVKPALCVCGNPVARAPASLCQVPQSSMLLDTPRRGAGASELRALRKEYQVLLASRGVGGRVSPRLTALSPRSCNREIFIAKPRCSRGPPRVVADPFVERISVGSSLQTFKGPGEPPCSRGDAFPGCSPSCGLRSQAASRVLGAPRNGGCELWPQGRDATLEETSCHAPLLAKCRKVLVWGSGQESWLKVVGS